MPRYTLWAVLMMSLPSVSCHGQHFAFVYCLTLMLLRLWVLLVPVAVLRFV